VFQVHGRTLYERIIDMDAEESLSRSWQCNSMLPRTFFRPGRLHHFGSPTIPMEMAQAFVRVTPVPGFTGHDSNTCWAFHTRRRRRQMRSGTRTRSSLDAIRRK
jgi:hypothetical protein